MDSAYIELLADYNVCDINVSTIRLNGIVPVEINDFEDINSRIGGYDEDGFLDLFVHFNIADVKEVLGEIRREKMVRLEVTGLLINDKPFYGVNWIKLMG
ncbi:MAG: hypothetical protein QXS51_06140 [Thermoproteota archaeon]